MKAVHIFGKSHLIRLAAMGVLLLALVLAQGLSRGFRPPTATRSTVGTAVPAQSGDFGTLPLAFEANAGQTDPAVRYMTHAPGGTLYFMPSEVVLALQSSSERQPSGAQHSVGLAALSNSETVAGPAPTTSVVRLQFIAANPQTVMSSGEALPGKVNYFIGNDPAKWHSDVPTYASAQYEQLYPGIGLTYEGTGGQLKGTYTVAAGADPSQIRWRYSGVENVTVDAAGSLQITVATNKEAQAVTVTEQMPVAWQAIGGTRTPVSARYVVAADHSIGFGLGDYDPHYPLTIDPILTYSTYLGGSGWDSGQDIAVDAVGNAYVTGFTNSANFPLQDPFQPTRNGGQDAFVTKFSATGSTLLYSTYLGGSSYDSGYGIAVDSAGYAYVTGLTQSANFPTQSPFQPTYGGGGDTFVTKLDPTGSTLLYSTYLGGSGYESGTGIAVDTSGSAYVLGSTNSLNFPTQNPFQPALGGGIDSFVAKLSAGGATLLYSTYLGGGNDDQSRGIGVDAAGNAVVTGYTNSANFPTQNPFQPAFGGDWDAFVTKFSPTGSTLIYSTYLGGSQQEGANGRIAVDAAGSAYVTGWTFSTNFPVQNAFQPTLNGFSDAFVTKFSPTGSTLLYSTYFGGSEDELGSAIAVDAAGNAYVTGSTTSTDFPLQDPFQPTWGGDWDVFVTEFNSAGSTLLYSSYLGGSGYEESTAIAVDTAGNAYVTGYAGPNFPLQNPFQPTYGGGDWDAFVAKIAGQVGSTPTATPVLLTSTSTPIRTTTPVSPSSTPVPSTATVTATAGAHTPTATSTAGPPSVTPCPVTFADVPANSTFYTWIRCLACRGIVGGYPCGGPGEPCPGQYYRPNNNVTRGQVSKIVSESAGLSDPVPSTQQTFEDVPPSGAFWLWVERLSTRGIIQGYPCGGPFEPCVGPANRPYFRPNNNVTRGQLSKITSGAAGWTETPTGQTFEDVPPSQTFYLYVERMAVRGIISGYPCGGPFEPCVGPANRPYFRPNNNATRGQMAKIAAEAFFPACQTPAH